LRLSDIVFVYRNFLWNLQR